MPLPKLAVPEYDCTLPVSGQKVNFRPFLVKEEKLLYLAMESQKEKEMIKAVKTILKNCTDLKSCLLYTSPSPRDGLLSRMPSSA